MESLFVGVTLLVLSGLGFLTYQVPKAARKILMWILSLATFISWSFLCYIKGWTRANDQIITALNEEQVSYASIVESLKKEVGWTSNLNNYLVYSMIGAFITVIALVLVSFVLEEHRNNNGNTPNRGPVDNPVNE